MMRLTPRDIRQFLTPPQELIDLITLALGTGVLPVGTKRMRKRSTQLLLQCLIRIQPLQHLLCVHAPVHTPMLLPRATDTLDATKVQTLLAQAFQHTI